MGMHTTKVAVGEGKFALEAQLTVTPRGMAVYACSPEFAHLGATAQAIPRPEPGRTATVSILAVPCHRDEIPAHDIAAALATRFGVPVVASTVFMLNKRAVTTCSACSTPPRSSSPRSRKPQPLSARRLG